MLRHIKKTLGMTPSSQPSTRPLVDVTLPSTQDSTHSPIEDLSFKEYADIFEEAYAHHMPPYDFRVWDRYLFSRCTTQEQFLGLLSLYEWVQGYRHYFDSEEIAKWCMNGQLACRVKRIIDTADRTGSAGKAKIKKDLEFLKSNYEILDLGPMNLSSVDDTHAETWFMQAKGCVKLRSSWDERRYHNEIKRKEQEAYFAFGVVVWGITPKPNWLLDDIRFDLWYKMGFGVVHFKGVSEKLFSRYQRICAKTRGIGAMGFFDFHLRWNIGKVFWCDFEKDWECSKPILKSLEDFLWIRRENREPSVYRLYHLMALSDQEYHHLIAAVDEKTVFDEAMVNYWLTRKSENKEADSIARKNIYSRVMEHIDDPDDLVYALKHYELPEFVQKVYDKLKISITERELALIWDDSR